MIFICSIIFSLLVSSHPILSVSCFQFQSLHRVLGPRSARGFESPLKRTDIQTQLAASRLPTERNLRSVLNNQKFSSKQNHNHRHQSHHQNPSSSALHISSSNNEGGDNDGRISTITNSRASGILVLLTVPFAWGTYAPVVKYVYEMDPPVPGFVFSGMYYLIAAFTLSLLSILQQKIFAPLSSTAAVADVNTVSYDDDKGEKVDMKMNGISSIDSSSISLMEQEKNPQSILQFIAGLELGSYLFIGNCLQVIGLKTVPADRAAFLVQLTTIMVPLFSATFAGDLGAIPILTWIACLLAFMGVIVMGMDDSIGGDSVSQIMEGFSISSFGDVQSVLSDTIGNISFSGGDVLIITAAVAYTMHVIRLGRYAKFTTPLGLAASKAGIEAVFSIVLVTLLISMGPSSDLLFVNEMSTEITSYFQMIKEQIVLGQFPPPGFSKVVGAVLWTGWVTCAYTIYAQSFGQRRVSPTDANLIYSMQPLFSALFAFVLLGEQLGPAGYIGGSFIASALWIVTSSNDDDDIEDNKTSGIVDLN